MQNHIIRSQVFEINCPKRDEAHDLQNRISRIFNTVLIGDYERLFDRLIGPDVVLRIDELNLDLESLDLGWTDEELANKILSTLESELKYRIAIHMQNQSTAPKAEEVNNDFDSLKLFQFFLINGSLPWWAGARFSDLEKLVIDVVKFNPAALREMLLREAVAETVRHRIVYQLTNSSIALLITVLQPAEASFILTYHTQAVKVQQKENSARETLTIEKAIWGFILDYLFMLRGSVFSRKEFVRQQLSQMSAHFNSSYTDFLAIFFKVLVPNTQSVLVEEFQNIIKELEQEENTVPDLNSKNQSRDKIYIGSSDHRPEETDLMMLISYFLKTGSVSSENESLSREQFAALAYDFWRRSPLKFKSYLVQEQHDEMVFKRLADLFKDGTFSEIIKLISPKGESFISLFLKEIEVFRKTKLISSVDKQQFTIDLKQQVLVFLLFKEEIDFSSEEFLNHIITQLAQRYSLASVKLLSAMMKSFNTYGGTEIYRSLENVKRVGLVSEKRYDGDSLPDHTSEGSNVNTNEAAVSEQSEERTNLLSTTVLRSERSNVNTNEAAASEQFEERKNPLITISLRNYLRYWIKFGHYPWWGEEWASSTPEKLFKQLLQQSADDAILILKIAGNSDSEKLRILNQLPVDTILSVLSLLKPVATFAGIFQLVRELASVNGRLNVPNSHLTDKLVLLIFWENLIQNNYNRIDEPELLKQVLFALSEYLRLPLGYLFEQVYNTSSIANQKQLEVLMDDISATLKEKMPLSDDYVNFLSFVRRSPDYPNNRLQFAEPRAKGGVVPSDALYILRFFLENNKLPPEGRSYSEDSIFLRQLLLHLYRYQRPELETALKQKKQNLEAAMQLHEAMNATFSIEEEQLKKLLSAMLETDLIGYVEQTIGRVQGTGNLQDLIELFNPDKVQTKHFLQTLFKYRSAVEHIAVSVSNQMIYKLFVVAKSGWEKNTEFFLGDLYLLLSQGFTDTLEREKFGALFREYILLYLSGRLRHATRESYIRGLLTFVAINRNQSLYALSEVFKPLAMKYSGTNKIAGLVLDELKLAPQKEKHSKYLDHIWKSADQLAQDKLVKPIQVSGEENNPIKQNTTFEPDDEARNKAKFLNEEAKIYINNAGLVLLHPFLYTYFQRLEMIKGGQFVSEELKMRAVHLLQYLVFGTEQHPEHELVLNKILCGIPLAEPVPLEIVLTDKEKAVSAELLAAVISRWEKLKNTSTESLQVSFLQREGFLQMTGDIWTLKVEQRGYDVLIQTLPWSLGMIKTSMMDNFINVEWV